jgi:endoglucanase
MEARSMDFLRRLMGTISPSGYEQEGARVWRQEAETFAEAVWGDAHGNSFAMLNEGGRPRVMFAGHIDEIGLLVTHIDENGFLYVQPIGGWDPQILPGQRVHIRTNDGDITGVLGKKPIHLIEKSEREVAVKLEDVWIDIGAEDKAEAESLVRVGDPAVIQYGFEELRNGLLVARGFDDRVGAFVVLEAARRLADMDPSAEVVAVGTVQEEIGLRGAQTSAFGLDPDVGVAVDVGFASDFPTMEEMKKKVGEVKMGDGPMIARGPNINPVVYDRFVRTADANDIPWQPNGEPRGTGTDANAIQLSRAGVATQLIGIPNRYMHTPGEFVHADDLANSADLIAQTVAGFDADADFTA